MKRHLIVSGLSALVVVALGIATTVVVAADIKKTMFTVPGPVGNRSDRYTNRYAPMQDMLVAVDWTSDGNNVTVRAYVLERCVR